MYLVAGNGKGFQLEEDQREEANNEHDDWHLVAFNDADDKHNDREN